MAHTAEQRWFFEGDPPGPLVAWFGAHAREEPSRVDRYLRLAGTDALGVKRRGGTARLELKLREAAGPDGVEVWQKWSLSQRRHAVLLPRLGLPAACWRDVTKVRRMAHFAWSAERGAMLAAGPTEAGCRAELARLTVAGSGPWSSVGLEAFGPEHLIRPALVAARDAILGAVGPVPGLEPERACGYPAWVNRLP